MTQATVIVVDNDPVTRDALDILVTAADHICQSFGSAEALLEHPLPEAPCCAIIDIQLPGIDGFELQAALNQKAANLPLVFVSSERSNARVTHAIQAGAVDFLAKPFNPEYLLTRVSCGLNASVASPQSKRPYWLDAIAPAELTPRQLSILQLMAYQTATAEIADILGLRADTVKADYTHAISQLRSQTCADDVDAWISRISDKSREGYPTGNGGGGT